MADKRVEYTIGVRNEGLQNLTRVIEELDKAGVETTEFKRQAEQLRQQLGSPVSDGGRGLKHPPQQLTDMVLQFARQRWRAWIETWTRCITCNPQKFARQRWRAWIETTCHLRENCGAGSSPVSDGGRGLKQTPRATPRSPRPVRPSAMAGVD